MSARTLSFCAVFLLSLGFSACGGTTPAKGNRCTSAGEVSCTDSDTAMVCQTCRGAVECARGGHSWQEFTCKGSGGCSGSICDQTANAAGDPCPDDKEGQSICASTDVHTRLTCTKHVLVADPCTNACSNSSCN